MQTIVFTFSIFSFSSALPQVDDAHRSGSGACLVQMANEPLVKKDSVQLSKKKRPTNYKSVANAGEGKNFEEKEIVHEMCKRLSFYKKPDPSATCLTAVAEQPRTLFFCRMRRRLGLSCASDRKVAYAVLVVGDDYIPGAVCLKNRLKQLASRHRLLILNAGSSEQGMAILSKNFDKRDIVSLEPTPNTPTHAKEWSKEWASITHRKMSVFSLTAYEKIVMLDSDVYLHKNIDDIFCVVDVKDCKIGMAPTMANTAFFNSGILVLKPSTTTSNELMALSEAVANGTGHVPVAMERVVGDQSILNHYFRHHICSIPSQYAFTKRDWQSKACQEEANMARVLNETKLFQFVGVGKPWENHDEAGSWGLGQLWRKSCPDYKSFIVR